MSLTISEIAQVYPFEGYTEQEIKRCVLALCNQNPEIRKNYLDWFGIKQVLDALLKAFIQESAQVYHFVLPQTTVKFCELEFQNKWLDKAEAIIPYFYDES